MSRLRIVVSGMIASDPHQGGAAWAVLQYVLGLRAMGHDVYLVEPIASLSVHPQGAALQDSTNARYFAAVMTAFDLTDRAALIVKDTHATVGLPYASLRHVTADADLLLNISGMLTDADLTGRIPRRVYLDLDPAFNQLWHAAQGVDMRFEGHTHFVTVGQAIGTPACPIPTDGRTWVPTLPPVVLSAWPMARGDSGGAWTTVGSWRGYGSIEHDGVLYGQKAHSLRRLLELPSRTRARIEPALAIHPGEVNDLAALQAHAWHIIDPATVTSTPADYQAFIQQSRGELGIAKSGYVESRCGWFSDRSACYLASGRPVVAQDTGFRHFLPTGEGLLTFNTTEEAGAALDAVEADYSAHRRRAREIAEAHFDANRVLGSLLDRVGGVAGA